MRVLLAEDDEILGAAVRDHIVAEGQSVDWVTGSTRRLIASTVPPTTLFCWT